jgi:hypothetical protein
MIASPNANPNSRVGPKETAIDLRSAGSSDSIATSSTVRVYFSSNSLTDEKAVENWAAATSQVPTSSGPLMSTCQTNRKAISRPHRDRP